MKIKEIAEISGVDERTIRRWIKTASDKMSGLSEKMSGSELTKKAADFTLEETIEIIRSGGNNTLAELLLENAKNKNAVSPVVNNSDIEKAIQFLFHEIKQLKKNKVKQIEAPKKEKPIIIKNYNLHGYTVSLVKYKNKTYQITPNFYNKHKTDLRFFDKNREWGAEIKLGFMSLDQLFRYIERTL